jgi:hypothetical protein
MKCKTIILTLTFISASLITSKVYSQNSDETNKVELDRKDSLDNAARHEAKVQETKDENRMANAKAEKKETKAKANDAKRIERDAADAARESRNAVKSERRAQKSRKEANDQAEKATKAREKSDNN